MAISPTSSTAAAIDALLKWKQTQTDSHNPQLLPQDDFIYLILTLKKIPQKGSINGARINPNKIPLPHPLISPGSSELCLIIDDRPGSNLSSKIAKQKIKDDGVCVSKVIKLSKLKTDYKPFEAKRKLCDSYDMFFADKRIIPLLPKMLGKQFFKKKKLPLGVDLCHKNWKEQIERACGSGLFYVRTGTCSVIRVAKASMERDEIVENVERMVEKVVEFVPKKLGGVRSLHLKFSDSVALPLWQALPDVKLKIEGLKRVRDTGVEGGEGEAMEVDEVGKKKKKVKRSRIHEVDHDMEGDEVGEVEKDDTVSEEKVIESEEKVVSEVKVAKKGVKGKKRKVNVVEEDDGSVKPSDKVAKKKVKKAEEGLTEAKSSEKSVKEKKRKGNAVKEDVVSAKSSDLVAKKKGKKQDADSGKKEKKKGRSVSRV